MHDSPKRLASLLECGWPASLRFSAAVLVAILIFRTAPAFAQSGSPAELMQLSSAAGDSGQAAAALPRIRSMIASSDSAYIGYARQVLLRALITIRASTAEIVAAADSTVRYLRDSPGSRVSFYGTLARTLSDRGEQLDQALKFARIADAEAQNHRQPQVRTFTQLTLGLVHLRAGNSDSAIVALSEALPASPDSQSVLFALGDAYHQKGKMDQAIDHYIRSLAVFPAKDTSATEKLRAAYLKRYGALRGLDERLAAARKTSRQRVALDERKVEGRAPAWKLLSLAGEPVQSSDHKGKVIVLDFWGSWCGPCRAELPFFQAMYERYKGKNVVFVGMNWERGRSREDGLRAAKDFMEKGRFTFPVVVDHDRSVADSYNVDGFPTVVIIDKTGAMRYRNVGFTEGIDEIMAAQIDSLLE